MKLQAYPRDAFLRDSQGAQQKHSAYPAWQEAQAMLGDGNTATLKTLLASTPVLLKFCTPHEQYELIHLAAMQGNTDCLRVVLDAGADIDSRSGAHIPEFDAHSLNYTPGWTPLIVAARAGRLEAVNFLLANYADAWLMGDQGYSALDAARDSTCTEVIKLLQHHQYAPWNPEEIAISQDFTRAKRGESKRRKFLDAEQRATLLRASSP